jgi:hypothetical protein
MPRRKAQDGLRYALFDCSSSKTRISAIHLAGLASEEARDSFVSR